MSMVQAQQQDYRLGHTGITEFLLPLGTRPVALGQAFTARADDANAGLWNPAGLAQISRSELGFLHAIYLVEVTLEYIQYAQPLQRNAGMGRMSSF
jgi:hypothetical protein